jgi:hypothetical protein
MANPRLGKKRVVMWLEEQELKDLILYLCTNRDINEIMKRAWKRGDIVG